ncbi:hypothetical protein LTR66_006250 [Elasticomyces elasticus]|nr:hypothetical protein LTR66_006250 [Elasticomyces elasticus]
MCLFNLNSWSCGCSTWAIRHACAETDTQSEYCFSTGFPCPRGFRDVFEHSIPCKLDSDLARSSVRNARSITQTTLNQSILSIFDQLDELTNKYQDAGIRYRRLTIQTRTNQVLPQNVRDLLSKTFTGGFSHPSMEDPAVYLPEMVNKLCFEGRWALGQVPSNLALAIQYCAAAELVKKVFDSTVMSLHDYTLYTSAFSATQNPWDNILEAQSESDIEQQTAAATTWVRRLPESVRAIQRGIITERKAFEIAFVEEGPGVPVEQVDDTDMENEQEETENEQEETENEQEEAENLEQNVAGMHSHGRAHGPSQ